MKERQPEKAISHETNPLRIEWHNRFGSVSLNLEMDGTLNKDIPPSTRGKIHHALFEMGLLFSTILHNQELFAAAGMSLETTLEASTDQIIDITNYLADLAAGKVPTYHKELPFSGSEQENLDPLEETVLLQQKLTDEGVREALPGAGEEEIPKPLFEGGWVMATPDVLAALKEGELELMALLSRHLTGDWGDISEEEKLLNDQAGALGERMTSAYRLQTGSEIWIVTAGDRQATWLKLPEQADPERWKRDEASE